MKLKHSIGLLPQENNHIGLKMWVALLFIAVIGTLFQEQLSGLTEAKSVKAVMNAEAKEHGVVMQTVASFAGVDLNEDIHASTKNSDKDEVLVRFCAS